MWRIIVNALLFDIAWPLCVLVDSVAVIVAFTLANLFIHLRIVADKPNEWLWVGTIWLCGASMDTLVFSSGVLVNDDGSPFPPAWLLLLWANFAMALRYSMFFLQKSAWLAVVLGGAFGPFSYWTGAWLNGTVEFSEPVILSVSVLVILWALFLPFTTWLSRRRIFSEVQDA
ncbi:DUF2878 domain-containing protein [Microbulbifer yueqingensis]|uniref:DUF2878 domain-containing protein n=1 Tax=Microbulbifer yueqingensis TaxID=658219 RepID=A0A1G8ZAY7_9GAMM|nr:DUF2878 domain-containing protein [Microbulbifer yueqingensis]SDK12187.1 Protein of unknown function [Microbulbifer yueqingensis]